MNEPDPKTTPSLSDCGHSDRQALLAITREGKTTATKKPPQKVMDALERVFAAEIEGRLPFQSKANVYRHLMAAGLVAPVQRIFGDGAPAITVSGYALTHAGRILYCSNC